MVDAKLIDKNVSYDDLINNMYEWNSTSERY
jgi:hypothetical protein